VAKEFGHDRILGLLNERSPADVRLVAAGWAADEFGITQLLAENPGLVARLSKADQRQLAHAARNNNLPAVRAMLAAGWPFDVTGQHRATPLHWAAFHGNAEMVEEILRYKPPLECTDADFNGTPLRWAIHGSKMVGTATMETILRPLKPSSMRAPNFRRSLVTARRR